VAPCGHNPETSRTPHSTIRYRPLIITLLTKQVVKHPAFVKLCKFKNTNVVPPIPNATDHGYIVDFLHGHVARKQLKLMKDNYEKNIGDRIIDESYEELSLLLGQFYDGAQVFKRRVTTFWPLVVQILNLPPNLRGKLGIGTFILSIISVDNYKKNGVEQFFYRDCLIAELEELEKGIKIECLDGRKYFLQARIVMHCLDSPALSKTMRIQGKGANVGCTLCLSFRATRREVLKKSSLYDHRRMLDYDHILRSFGQSRKCCPADYYQVREPEPLETDGRYKALMLPYQDPKQSQLFKTWCLVANPNDPFPVPTGVVESIKRLLTSNPPPFKCYSKCFKAKNFMSLFGNYMYFAHANYMKRVEYNRVSNNTYLYHAREFHRKVENKSFDITNQAQHVNGVREAWEFARLSYTDFQRHVCWDPFHVFMDVCGNILHNLAGKRLTSKSITIFRNTACHLSLWLSCPRTRSQHGIPSSPAYVLSIDAKNRADAYMACLLLPQGTKQDYNVLHPFGRMGYLKGHAKILIMTAYIDYLLYGATHLPKEYKNGLSLYGWNMSRLLSPVLQIKDSEHEAAIRNEIIECICILEGLFPESEAMFPKHQILDLVSQLKQFGPIKGWWALYGERAIGSLKQFVPKGGRNYTLSTFLQYIDFENSTNEKFFVNIDRILRLPADSAEYTEEGEAAICEQLNVDRDGEFRYDGFITYLSSPMHGSTFEITQYDMEKLLSTILEEITKRCISHWQAMSLSPLYYMIEYYCKYIAPGGRARAEILLFLWWVKEDMTKWEHTYQDQIDERDMNDLDHAEIEEAFTRRSIFRSCLVVAKALLSLKVEMFKKATILGTKLVSRGFHCRESKKDKRFGYGKQEKVYMVQNDKNILRNNWNETLQYSCWCKLTTTKPIPNFIRKSPENRSYGHFYRTDVALGKRLSLYAQINCFFAILIPDRMVAQIALASVTCREYTATGGDTTFRNLYEIDVHDPRSFNADIRFVPISHILPTVVAVAGLKKEHKVNAYLPIRVLKRSDEKHLYAHSFPEAAATDIEKLLLMNVTRNHAEDLFSYIVAKFGQKPFQVNPLNSENVRSTWEL